MLNSDFVRSHKIVILVNALSLVSLLSRVFDLSWLLGVLFSPTIAAAATGCSSVTEHRGAFIVLNTIGLTLPYFDALVIASETCCPRNSYPAALK